VADVHCFTSISLSYLDRALVLAETIRRYQPDWVLWLCLSDTEPPGQRFDTELGQFDHVTRVEDLGIPDLRPWLFCHDVIELCTAVKGQMLLRLLDGGASKVVYLDPDVALFSPLDTVIEALDRHDVILTPHQLEPDADRAAILDNEIGSLKHGVYNLGFVAVRNSDEGRRFASWWRDRLLAFCYDNIPSGLFTDQRWCDLAPAFFTGVHILRDPGCNVASWNLSRRPITIGADGVIRAAGAPLRFFHFTKVTWVGEVMLERYGGGRIEVFELLRWYRVRLAAHEVSGLPAGWWAYATYDDGQPIPREHRVAYRSRAELQARFLDPFAVGENSFRAWLRNAGGPAPRRAVLQVRNLFPFDLVSRVVGGRS
jgi:hypothetical protein